MSKLGGYFQQQAKRLENAVLPHSLQQQYAAAQNGLQRAVQQMQAQAQYADKPAPVQVKVGDVITDPETIRRLQPGTRVRLRDSWGHTADVRLVKANERYWDADNGGYFHHAGETAYRGIEILALPEPAEQPRQVPYVERDPDKLRVGMVCRNPQDKYNLTWKLSKKLSDRWRCKPSGSKGEDDGKCAWMFGDIRAGLLEVVALPESEAPPAPEQPDLRTVAEVLRNRVPSAPKPAVRRHRMDRYAGNRCADCGSPVNKGECIPVLNWRLREDEAHAAIMHRNDSRRALGPIETPLADAAMRASDPMSYSGAGGITGALFNKKGRIA